MSLVGVEKIVWGVYYEFKELNDVDLLMALNLDWKSPHINNMLDGYHEIATRLSKTPNGWLTALQMGGWRMDLMSVCALLVTANRSYQCVLQRRAKQGSMASPQIIQAIGLLHSTTSLSFLRQLAYHNQPGREREHEAARLVLKKLDEHYPPIIKHENYVQEQISINERDIAQEVIRNQWLFWKYIVESVDIAQRHTKSQIRF